MAEWTPKGEQRFPPGNPGRPKDIELTCVTCGETKKAAKFPRRAGEYTKYGLQNPKRYDKQCKLCKKPAKPGQAREEVPEPKLASGLLAHRNRPPKPKKKKPAKKRVRNREQAREYKKKIREHTRVKCMEYAAEKGCEICGERDPRKLEFDHREPCKKSQQISRLISNGYTWSSPTLRREIRKCRILCANCHRAHTVKQQGYYASDAVQATLGRLAARFKFEL